METTFFPWADVSALHFPARRDRKSLNCQDMIARTQEIEVEEVETVETVEATGTTGTQRRRSSYRHEKADINRGLVLKVPRSDKSRRMQRTILKAW